jgi:hypothetical protein
MTDAGGKGDVPGGNEKLGYAITGSARFAQSESYDGVKGGFPVGGAGYLVQRKKKK